MVKDLKDWRLWAALLFYIVIQDAQAIEVSGSVGAGSSDWRVMAIRVNGERPITWYVTDKLYSGKVSLCGGVLGNGRRVFAGWGVCNGDTDSRYIGTPWRYNFFAGVYLNKRRTIFAMGDHESNCKSAFWGVSESTCLGLPRGPQDKPNKGINWVRIGFRFNTNF
jgi:hypothetical protein